MIASSFFLSRIEGKVHAVSGACDPSFRGLERWGFYLRLVFHSLLYFRRCLGCVVPGPKRCHNFTVVLTLKRSPYPLVGRMNSIISKVPQVTQWVA